MKLGQEGSCLVRKAERKEKRKRESSDNGRGNVKRIKSYDSTYASLSEDDEGTLQFSEVDETEDDDCTDEADEYSADEDTESEHHRELTHQGRR